MKPSRYNYIVPFGKKTIFFNGLTEQFFSVQAEHKEAYETILSSPDEYDANVHSFIDKMKANGFVIDDDVDELASVREKFEALRKSHQYYLMVLPTYQCNLRCWYCIQKHENMFMTSETLERVKKLIVNKLSDPEITEFHLSWFGGEPLMAYDKVLELTLFARDYCREIGKDFSSAITTNGTLLTPSRIEALREAGVANYQITIDGDRDTHNSVKQLGNNLAYDTTLKNINLIAKHTHVTLRFNYTHENLKADRIYESLKSTLDLKNSRNITFMLFKVWQENEEDIAKEDVDRLFNYGIQLGMRSSLATSGVCYADRVHYDCVFPNGHIGKCDNHNPEDMPGILQEDGSILWTEEMEDFYSPHLFDGRQAQCAECRCLPVCWGPCIAKRETMLRNKGEIHCLHQDRDKWLTGIVLNHCKAIMQETPC